MLNGPEAIVFKFSYVKWSTR